MEESANMEVHEKSRSPLLGLPALVKTCFPAYLTGLLIQYQDMQRILAPGSVKIEIRTKPLLIQLRRLFFLYAVCDMSFREAQMLRLFFY